MFLESSRTVFQKLKEIAFPKSTFLKTTLSKTHLELRSTFRKPGQTLITAQKWFLNLLVKHKLFLNKNYFFEKHLLM